MRHYIIASHGEFASGIYESIKIIANEQPNVQIINAYVESVDIQSLVDKAIRNIPQGECVVVLTDLFGGSVNNEFMKYINNENFYLITGMNLPLLIQIFLSTEEDTEKMIRDILSNKDTNPKFCNDLIRNGEEEDF